MVLNVILMEKALTKSLGNRNFGGSLTIIIYCYLEIKGKKCSKTI